MGAVPVKTFELTSTAQSESNERLSHPRYEQAGADVKESLSGWAKQQEAALAEDQVPSRHVGPTCTSLLQAPSHPLQDEVDRLRKALEEARR